MCPRLRNSLVSKSISSNDLSPLLDLDSIIQPQLPDDIGGLLEEFQGTVHRGRSNNLNSSFQEAPREVDFEQLEIGVHSSEMEYGEMDDGYESSPSFIIPKRVYILELPSDR